MDVRSPPAVVLVVHTADFGTRLVVGTAAVVDTVAAAVVRSRPAAVVPWAHTGDFGMAAFGIVAAEVHRK